MNQSVYRYLSEKLSEYIHNLELKEIPDTTVRNAKMEIIDAIGATVTGTITEQGKIICKLAKTLGGNDESTIFHFGGKVAVQNAVLANGTLGFALDIDDGHKASSNHMSGMISTAINMCEREGLGGREMLLSSINRY